MPSLRKRRRGGGLLMRCAVFATALQEVQDKQSRAHREGDKSFKFFARLFSSPMSRLQSVADSKAHIQIVPQLCAILKAGCVCCYGYLRWCRARVAGLGDNWLPRSPASGPTPQKPPQHELHCFYSTTTSPYPPLSPSPFIASSA